MDTHPRPPAGRAAAAFGDPEDRMVRSSHATVTESALSPARLALLQRIQASRHFASAEVLRKLLVFLCERSAQAADAQLKEFEIAVEALGKPSSFDPRTDPIVRVHIASIRERLQAYFEQEGRHETLRLEIPRGRYRAVFTEARALPAHVPDERRGPSLERLWKPYFAGTAPNTLVFSDLLFFRDDEGTYLRNVYLNDLASARPAIDERYPTLDLSTFSPSFHFVSAGEMETILAITRMFAAFSTPVEAVKTRFSSWNSLRQSNLILIGSSRTNTFLDALQGEAADFVITQDRIENPRPQHGEQPFYSRSRRRDGKLDILTEYAVVTRRQGLGPGLTVTMIAANHGRAIEGAGDFLTNDRRVQAMLEQLDLADTTELPAQFQLLLRVDLVDFDEEVAEVRFVTARL
jgi:hypothetical protein